MNGKANRQNGKYLAVNGRGGAEGGEWEERKIERERRMEKG
jgi:hypothetical protein